MTERVEGPARPDRSPAAGLLCPVCRVDLVMSERQTVEIDYCPKCRGVWLDRGELDKILERSAIDLSPRPPEPRQDYSQADYERPDYDRSDYDHYERPKHKRRSFLHDLFD